MNWEAIGAIGETIGAIAVVLTLVYLSIQIRQNTRSVRAATYQSVAEALADCSYKLVGHMEDQASDRRLLFIGTISGRITTVCSCCASCSVLQIAPTIVNTDE